MPLLARGRKKRFSRSAGFLFPFLLFLLAARLAVPSDEDPYRLNERGIALLKEGKYSEAIHAFQQALKYLPNNEIIQKNLATAFGKAGDKRYREKDYSSAVEMLRQAVHYDPEREDIGLLLASALKKANLAWEAEAEYRRLIRVFPKSPSAYKALGHFLYESNQMPEALDLWKKAIELDPEDEQLKKWLEKGEREEAIEGEFVQLASTQFTIRFGGKADPEISYKVLEILEETYSRLGEEWNHFPQKPIPVILYSHADFKTVTGAHGWVGGVYDGKIRVPIKNIPQIEDLRRVIVHEFTHALVHDLTQECPLWLNEGLAQIEEGKKGEEKAKELARALKEGDLVPLARMPESFAQEKDGKKVNLLYAQSLSFVEFLIQRCGKESVVRVLKLLGEKKKLKEAVQESLASSLKELERDWQEALEE